ncbi:thiamine diphosphate-binding protein [Mycena leptocephala]|nr:thiamine diphosphate-binding protein [Mycena leptocephala]
MSTQPASSLQAEVNRLRLQLESLQVKDDYLLARLEQLKVTKMFGVPGDFNLGFLVNIFLIHLILWLIYGYARVKEHSIGVVLTTFGVGELSAINGIAGAFSEMVPILHIVGVPSTIQQKTKPMLHHTLGDGRYDAYIKAAENFTISQAILADTNTAAAEIDRVLTDCITRARPVYLTLPTNLVFKKISSERLKIPLSRLPPPNDPEMEEFVLDEIVKLVENAADDIVILVDACAIRHDVRDEVNELITRTGYPVYSAPMGKTAVSENYERYGGIYVGSISHPDIKEKVESAKLILSVGCLKSDFNTGNFTYSIPLARTIEFHSDHTKVQFAGFQGLGMKELLPLLTARLQPCSAEARKIPVPDFTAVIPTEEDNVISQAWFWPTMGKFFRPKDVIIAETGTSSFGILDVPLPENLLGAAFAARDIGLNRPILFIGDGSLQLTVQELSVILRHGLKPIIFLLNNSGYTIERFLHGKERKYNDISNWKWTALLGVLGDAEGTLSQSYTVHTKDELAALLDDASFAQAGKMQLVEVMMRKHDAPRALVKQAELSGKTNAYVAL